MLERASTVGLLCLATLAPVLASGCIANTGGPTDPKSVAIYDVAADEFRKGHLREALSKVNEAIDADSNNAEAAHLGALIYLAFCAKDVTSPDCRFDAAEKLARTAMENDEKSGEARNTLGVVLIHQKKYDDAIEVLKPLTADILYGSPQTSWGNLGWAYLEKGSYNDAIDALRRSVASQPAFCVGSFRLGLAYEKKKDLRAAKEAYRRAVETDRPGCKGIQEAWEGKGRTEAGLGLVADARTSFGRCADLARSSESGTRCEVALKGLPVHTATAAITPSTPQPQPPQPSSPASPTNEPQN